MLPAVIITHESLLTSGAAAAALTPKCCKSDKEKCVVPSRCITDRFDKCLNGRVFASTSACKHLGIFKVGIKRTSIGMYDKGIT